MAVAGPSSRKRTAKQRDSEDATTSKAPLESFGHLELVKELQDGEEGSVDEDYSSSEGDEDSEDSPELDAESSDDEDEEDELSEDEQVLRELAEEEELENDLAETSDSSFSDGEIDANDPDALDHAIRKATRKPDENFEDGTTVHSSSAHALNQRIANSELLGFDTRSYKDKARVGKSAITGEERWTWDEIQPGWESDEGAEEGENRVGKIPDYFYEGMPHVGYDNDGKRVMRPVKGDELDKFLASIDDPSSWYIAFLTLSLKIKLNLHTQDICGRQADAEECAIDRRRARLGTTLGKSREPRCQFRSLRAYYRVVHREGQRDGHALVACTRAETSVYSK